MDYENSPGGITAMPAAGPSPEGTAVARGVPPRRWRGLIGPVAAATAGVLLALSLPLRAGYDFFPQPDAAEYAWVAQSIVEDQEIRLPVGGVWIPSRYPPGFPLLLSFFMWIFHLAPHHLVPLGILFGGLTVGMVYAVTRSVSSTPAAAGAAFLVATSPLFLMYSGRVMSDVPSMAWGVILLACWLAVHKRPASRGRLELLLALGLGILAGYGILLRLVNAALIVPYGIISLRRLADDKQRFRALAFMTGLVPMAVVTVFLNWKLYGSPWETGYGYWFPGLFKPFVSVMNPRYILGCPDNWRSIGSLEAYGRYLLGQGGVREMLLPPLALVLLVPGLVHLWRRRGPAREASLVIVVSLISLVFLCGLYRWQITRLMMPAVPLIALGAGAGFAYALAVVARGGGWGRVLHQGLLVVLMMAVIGQGIWSIGATRTANPCAHPSARDGLTNMAALVDSDALIITDVLLPLVHFYLVPDRQAEVYPLIIRSQGRHIWHEDHARQLLAGRPEWSTEIRHYMQVRSGGLDSGAISEIRRRLRSGRQTLLLTGYTAGTSSYVYDFRRFWQSLGKQLRVTVVAEADGLTLYRLGDSARP